MLIEVTEEKLSTIKERWYRFDQELKAGDKICYGFTNQPDPNIDSLEKEISLCFKTFVLKENFLFELYSKS